MPRTTRRSRTTTPDATPAANATNAEVAVAAEQPTRRRRTRTPAAAQPVVVAEATPPTPAAPALPPVPLYTPQVRSDSLTRRQAQASRFVIRGNLSAVRAVAELTKYNFSFSFSPENDNNDRYVISSYPHRQRDFAYARIAAVVLPDDLVSYQ